MWKEIVMCRKQNTGVTHFYSIWGKRQFILLLELCVLEKSSLCIGILLLPVLRTEAVVQKKETLTVLFLLSFIPGFGLSLPCPI